MILDMDKNYFYVVEDMVHQQVDFERYERERCVLLSVVILDAPTGMNSDIWLPLQERLKSKSTVINR